MVAAEMALILEVQTEEFWQDITLGVLENARRKLRKLVKLIEPKDRKIVYTDFEDEIGAAIDMAFPTIGTGTDRARFLMKVRHFLTQHESHITLAKLRRNEQLTPQDLSELERMFLAESVASPDDLERIRGEGGLGLFIRSLVGLDREAAKQALGGFVSGRTLSANQIEWLLSRCLLKSAIKRAAAPCDTGVRHGPNSV
jgi:type I restriction enzyme R subunit